MGNKSCHEAIERARDDGSPEIDLSHKGIAQLPDVIGECTKVQKVIDTLHLQQRTTTRSMIIHLIFIMHCVYTA